MQIAKLTYDRFKGITESLAVEKLNYLTGPNGSGKTGRLQGIEFAITGKTDLGAALDNTARLSGSDGCTVEVLLDDGFVWSRGLKRQRSGTISETFTVSQKKEDKKTAAPLIAEHVGGFAPIFDLAEFSGLSAERKRDIVLELCSQGGMSSEVDPLDVKATISIETGAIRIGAAQVDVLSATVYDGKLRTDLSSEQKQEMWDKIALTPDYRESVDSVINSICSSFPSGDIGSVCAELINRVKSIKSAAKQQETQAEETSRSLAKKKAELTVVSGSVNELDEKRQGLVQDRNSIIEQIGNQRGRASAIEHAESNLAQAKQLAAKANEATEVDVEPIKAEIERLTKEKAGIIKESETLGSVSDAQNQASESAFRMSQAYAKYEQLKNQVSDTAAQLERVEKSNVHAALVLLQGIEWKLPVGAQKAIDEAVELLEVFVGDDTAVTYRTELVRLESEMSEAEKRFEDAKEEHAVQAKVLNELSVTTDRLKKELQTVSEALQAADLGMEQASVINSQQARNLENAERDVLKYEAQLNELRSTGGDVPLEQLTEQSERLKEAIAEVQSQIEAKREAESLEKVYAQSVADRAAAESRQEAAKDVEAAIRATRDRSLHLVVSPIKERIDRVLSVARTGYTSYCDLSNDRGRSIFDLGWVTPLGLKISWPAISGGEKGIFGSALAYAMTSLSTVPLKVLLIEGGEMDANRLSDVLSAIETVADELSNVFVATHTVIESGEQWNRIELGEFVNG